MIDEPAVRVESEFKKFMLESAKKNSRTKDENGEYVYSYYAIYYSGHGKMNMAATVGIDADN
jgi:hypothetical protein